MKFKELYKFLEKTKCYILSFKDLLSIFPDEKNGNLKKIVYRWKKSGWLQYLKKGLYELSYPKDFLIPDEYVANKLYSPSYISLETVLSSHSIIPEVAMAVTSVTTKPTRNFKNKHGLFIYRTLKSSCYSGYYVKKIGVFDILVAEPEKALMDFLYFKSFHRKPFNLKEERLDKNVILNLDGKKLKRYSKLFNINLKEFYANL